MKRIKNKNYNAEFLAQRANLYSILSQCKAASHNTDKGGYTRRNRRENKSEENRAMRGELD